MFYSVLPQCLKRQQFMMYQTRGFLNPDVSVKAAGALAFSGRFRLDKERAGESMPHGFVLDFVLNIDEPDRDPGRLASHPIPRKGARVRSRGLYSNISDSKSH